METLKSKVGVDYSVNYEATVKVDGVATPATDILCQFLPAALLALEAAKALSKNFFVKMVIGIAYNALETLGEAFCEVK